MAVLGSSCIIGTLRKTNQAAVEPFRGSGKRIDLRRLAFLYLSSLSFWGSAVEREITRLELDDSDRSVLVMRG